MQTRIYGLLMAAATVFAAKDCERACSLFMMEYNKFLVHEAKVRDPVDLITKMRLEVKLRGMHCS